MSSPEELQPVLENMRRTWNQRAEQNAQYYVYTGIENGEDFEASGRVNYEQVVRPFLPVLLRGRSPRQCRVIEIGCGLGRMTACFAQEFQEVHGIDVAPEMIAKAQERLSAYRNVFLHTGSGMDLAGVPSGHFDLAFSYLVFQHVPSRGVIQNYLREAARVLKPGGAFHFQVNGYLAPEYRQGEKDSWLGESFSFPEAVEMLRAAGFSPFNSVGAGTQYFVLSARRAGEEPSALSSFILPGEAWPQEQLLEGWSRDIPGDCRPVAAVNRVRLGLPAGESARLFLSLHCAAADLYPTITLSLDDHALGAVPIKGPGDHYCELPIPRELSKAASAVVTLGFQPAHSVLTVGVRSIGIYSLNDEGQDGAGEKLESSERIFWIANVEQECSRLARVISQSQAELASKVSWALSMHADIEDKVAWARSLERDLEKARGDLAQLQAEFDERTAWALSLRQDVESARSAWAHSQNELTQCAARAQQLEETLRQAYEKPWGLIARKLRAMLKALIQPSRP